MYQIDSHVRINEKAKDDAIKDKTKVLEIEKLRLLHIIYSDARSSNKLFNLKIKTEEKCSSTFKIMYPAIYLEILKSEIAALKAEVMLCKSIGENHWRT